MDNITLGQIQSVFVWLIGFGGATLTIIKSVKKAITKAFEPIEKKIDKVDMNATKNYLVARIDDLDNGKKLDGVSRERFYEEIEHYQKDLKGNSYILAEIKRLEKEGKL